MWIKVAAMYTNSAPRSMSISRALSMYSRYCDVMVAIGMSLMSICCLRIRSSSRSRGPSYCARWKLSGEDTTLHDSMRRTRPSRERGLFRATLALYLRRRVRLRSSHAAADAGSVISPLSTPINKSAVSTVLNSCVYGTGPSGRPV